MRRTIVTLLVVLAGVTGCASAPPAPVAPSPDPTTSASPTGPGPAEAYCAAVDEFIAANREAVDDPLKADTKALRRQYEQLRAQAEALPGQLIDDPDAIPKVQACTQRLQQFNAAQ